jgi:hypothetical protein
VRNFDNGYLNPEAARTHDHISLPSSYGMRRKKIMTKHKPYSTALEDLIEDNLQEDKLEKKRMFGGICYLINGNMSFAVWQDYLIVRMAPELAAEELKNDYVRAFDLTGRPMKGWVMVEKCSWNERGELARWLNIGKSFALSLPKKSPKKKTLEEIYYRNQR